MAALGWGQGRQRVAFPPPESTKRRRACRIRSGPRSGPPLVSTLPGQLSGQLAGRTLLLTCFKTPSRAGNAAGRHPSLARKTGCKSDRADVMGMLMIAPPFRALRRRARELQEAAERERTQDEDTAALLLFYAAECALKAAYMDQHQLADTASETAQAPAASSFGHDLVRLIEALRVPAGAIGPLPAVTLQRSGAACHRRALHEAWRYGEKISDTRSVFEWLSSIVIWARKST